MAIAEEKKKAKRTCKRPRRPSLGELTATAELLVGAGRRADAIDMLENAVDVHRDPRVVLLIARLNLESGTRAGAEACMQALSAYRMWNRWDLDAIAMMRAALVTLGAVRKAHELDREVRWSACRTPAARARSTRS